MSVRQKFNYSSMIFILTPNYILGKNTN